jgi:hypothetical protein
VIAAAAKCLLSHRLVSQDDSVVGGRSGHIVPPPGVNDAVGGEESQHEDIDMNTSGNDGDDVGRRPETTRISMRVKGSSSIHIPRNSETEDDELLSSREHSQTLRTDETCEEDEAEAAAHHKEGGAYDAGSPDVVSERRDAGQRLRIRVAITGLNLSDESKQVSVNVSPCLTWLI